MKRITEAEAARRFSHVLDEVERSGETFVVERHGRVVARISPTSAANGRTVKDLLAQAPPDDTSIEHIREVRALLHDGVSDWPD